MKQKIDDQVSTYENIYPELEVQKFLHDIGFGIAVKGADHWIYDGTEYSKRTMDVQEHIDIEFFTPPDGGVIFYAGLDAKTSYFINRKDFMINYKCIEDIPDPRNRFVFAVENYGWSSDFHQIAREVIEKTKEKYPDCCYKSNNSEYISAEYAERLTKNLIYFAIDKNILNHDIRVYKLADLQQIVTETGRKPSTDGGWTHYGFTQSELEKIWHLHAEYYGDRWLTSTRRPITPADITQQIKPTPALDELKNSNCNRWYTQQREKENFDLDTIFILTKGRYPDPPKFSFFNKKAS